MTLLMLKVMHYILEMTMKNNSMISELHRAEYKDRCGPFIMEKRNEFRNKGHDQLWELQQQIENLTPTKGE